MKKNAFQSSWLPVFVFVLCVLQPLLDVLSFWTQDISWGSYLTLSLRFLLLVTVTGTAFLLSDHRRPYYICVGVCAVYYVCHICACTYADPSFLQNGLFDDFTNFVRVIQLPLFTLSFVTFLRSSESVRDSLERGLTAIFLIIAAVNIISVVTHTNPYTYANKSIGIMGWFTTGNVQSAILSSLYPLVLCIALKDRCWPRTVFLVLLGTAMLYFYATRLAYLAIFVTLVGTLFVWVVCKKCNRRIVILLLICAVLCGATYSVSPMTRNQTLVAGNAVKKQDRINELLEEGTSEFGTDSPEQLRYVYEEYLPDLVERFGLSRVAEQYQYSTDVSTVASIRTMKLNYCRLLLQDRPVWSSIFGLSYDDMKYNSSTYDVENDFHGILYLYGYAGLFCLLLFLAAFLLRIVIVLVRDAKTYFTVEAGSLGISLLLCLAHAYETSGVLRRPNASFYLSLVLGCIWYLTEMPARSPAHGSEKRLQQDLP